MNRLSFLKKLSVGIAVAVITPKVLTDIPVVPKELPKDAEWGRKWAKEVYRRWRKDKDLGVASICMYDGIIDKNNNHYMVTAKNKDTIELTAFDGKLSPNFLEVKKEVFNDYFVRIMNISIEKT